MICDQKRALSFLSNSLQFTDEEINLKDSSKLKFLQVFVKKFYENEPFGNFNTHINKMKAERGELQSTNPDLISIEYILKQLEARRGGACFLAAYGSQVFLKALGFDSYITWTYTENRPGAEAGHFVLIVKNLENIGDLYLIDFGTRLSPLNVPVPLHELKNENQESEVFTNYYMLNKFVRKGDDILRYTGKLGSESELFLFYRVKHVPEVVSIEAGDGENLSFKTFPPVPKRKTPQSVEHKKPQRSFWFQRLMIIGFPHGKTRLIRDKEYMYQTDSGDIVRENKETSSDLAEEIMEHYPQFGEKDIKETLEAMWESFLNNEND